MLSLAILIVLAFGSGLALRQAVDLYRAGMTSDAILFTVIFVFCSTLAVFYQIGYEVAQCPS